MFCENRTVGFEEGGATIGPCPKLGKPVSQEYLEKGEQLVVSNGDDRVKVVQCIKVEDSRYAKGSNNRVDGGRTTLWGG